MNAGMAQITKGEMKWRRGKVPRDSVKGINLGTCRRARAGPRSKIGNNRSGWLASAHSGCQDRLLLPVSMGSCGILRYGPWHHHPRAHLQVETYDCATRSFGYFFAFVPHTCLSSCFKILTLFNRFGNRHFKLSCPEYVSIDRTSIAPIPQLAQVLHFTNSNHFPNTCRM